MRHLGVVFFAILLWVPSFASAQTPRYSWQMDLGSGQLGIVDFHDHFYLQYGFGSIYEPYSLEHVVLGGIAAGATLAFAVLAWRGKPKGNVADS